MTEPCARFIRSHQELVEWLALQVRFAEQLDHVARITAEALAHPEAPEKPEITAEDQLRKHARLNFELSLCRCVDNYLAYLSELMALVFQCRPETLRSSEKVEIEFILKHESLDELIEALTERRVERLSYSGLVDLDADVRERMGFELFASDRDREEAARLVELRNLIVHKRAVVDRRYIARTGDDRTPIGKRIPLRDSEREAIISFIPRLACETDARAVAKWGLPAALSKPELAGDGSGDNRVRTDPTGTGSTEAE